MFTVAATSLRSRIARRIFGVFLLCALIPFAGLVLVSYRQVTEFFNDKSQRQLRALAKSLGMDTYERLLLLEGALQIIASAVESSGTAPSEKTLDRLASTKARWSALAIITEDGRRHALLGEVETFPEFTAPQKTHLASGKALILIQSATQPDPARIFMSLATDPRRRRGPIVVGEVKPAYLWSFTESRILPSYIKTCALEVTGLTLMCSSADHLVPGALLRKIDRSAVGEFEWTEKGLRYQASYWTIPIKFEFQTSEWIVVLLASKEGIFASISDLKNTFVLWTVACVGLSLLLALCQIRKRLVPVEKLREATQRIAHNDFDSRVAVRSADEFEELATAFNGMAAQLGHQFNTLNTTADIQRAVLSLLDTTKIAETILGRMMTVLHCDCATLTLFSAGSEDSESTFIVRGHGTAEIPSKAESRPRGTPPDGADLIEVTASKEVARVAHRAADSAEPLILNNMLADAQLLRSEWLQANGFNSCLAAPLNINDRAFGAMSFYSNTGRVFTEKDLEFVLGLTSQAAIAIYNSQLYERTKCQAAELAIANRTKDEFLSVMSHELRTPINVILGYITLIQDNMLGEVNADQARALTTVTTHSKDLLVMIERIMDVTNLESGAVLVESDEINLLDLVQALKSQFEGPLEKPIELVWDYPVDLPVLKTDASKLKRIIVDLLDNALKFTEKGQVVFSIKSSAANESVTFEVADTGPGIADEAVPMIFQRFRQLDSSATREHEGVGLGLYIVKKLSDLLGAKLEVKTRLGAGTTFAVTFLTPESASLQGCNEYPKRAYR
jgi:signal transduction histidine kinase